MHAHKAQLIPFVKNNSLNATSVQAVSLIFRMSCTQYSAATMASRTFTRSSRFCAANTAGILQPLPLVKAHHAVDDQAKLLYLSIQSTTSPLFKCMSRILYHLPGEEKY